MRTVALFLLLASVARADSVRLADPDPPLAPFDADAVLAPFDADAVLAFQVDPLAERPIYPYSVHPGGAESVEEAREMVGDPGLFEIALKTDERSFSSYRWTDGRIYWTRKMIALRAGESVYVGASGTYRARCLNRLSFVPMLPTRSAEPIPSAYDSPIEYASEVPEESPLAEQPTPTEVPPDVARVPGAGSPGGSNLGWLGWLPVAGAPFLFEHRHPAPAPAPIPVSTAAIPEPSCVGPIALGLILFVVFAPWTRGSK